MTSLIKKIIFNENFWFLALPFVFSKIKKRKMSQKETKKRETEEAERREKEERKPLFMPEGSVRAMLVLIVTIATVTFIAVPTINCPDWFFDLFLVMVGYYTGFRTPLKKKGA
jgi:H+/gluconate symporter-like permease